MSQFSAILVEVFFSLLSTVSNFYSLFSSLSWSNKIFLCYMFLYVPFLYAVFSEIHRHHCCQWLMGGLTYISASAFRHSALFPLPWLSSPFQHCEALQKYLYILRIFLPLSPPPEHHSPSEPCFVTHPELYFDIL